MSSHYETNPHFLPPPQRGSILPFLPQQQRRHQNQFPQPQPSPTPHSPTQQTPLHQTQHPEPKLSPGPHFPTQHQTDQHPQPHPGLPETHFPVGPQHSTLPVQPHRPPSSPRIQHPHKTRSNRWLIGVCCGLFWISMILGGLAVLIIYLVFRPQDPKFDITAASFNIAYLDLGYLLNADINLLTNVTNPSHKVAVDFHYIVINLYYEDTLIAASNVDPFSAAKAESVFRNVDLVSRQIWLSSTKSQLIMQQIESNSVRFEVKSLLRTKSKLGSFFKYSYWLHGHCIIELSGPPGGVLVGKKCTTKR